MNRKIFKKLIFSLHFHFSVLIDNFSSSFSKKKSLKNITFQLKYASEKKSIFFDDRHWWRVILLVNTRSNF